MNFYSVQTILVPIDLSDTSLNALNSAVSISQKTGARVQILNVTERLFYLSDNATNLSYSSSKSKDVLNALVGTINHGNKIYPALIQKEGNVVECIIETALAEKIDLIIMGTHGASGFRDGFIGSNAYNVVKYSSCPVLTIPPIRKFSLFEKILFPIRPVTGALMSYHVASHFLADNPLIQVLGLAYQRMDKDSTILDKIVSEIRPLIQKDKGSVTTSWGNGNSVSEDILNYAQLHAPELIILTSILDVVKKSNFIGPHTQKILNCSKIPVLNINRLGVHAFA